MSDSYEFRPGTTPLLVSMPHGGTDLPDPILERLSEPAKRLPDTDWHIPRLYEFAADLGASIVTARYSRYVIDLNRPPDDERLYAGQATTGLCPDLLFDGTPLYADGQPVSDEEVAERLERYWRPYHAQIAEELGRIKERYGYALLYDAHSIASRVPRLFTGRLPDLNLGTARGTSCDPEIEDSLAKVVSASAFTSAVNGRFVGGYITRHYGQPAERIHAVQMEMAQSSYMDEREGYAYEEAKAAKVEPTLRRLLETFLSYRPSPG